MIHGIEMLHSVATAVATMRKKSVPLVCTFPERVHRKFRHALHNKSSLTFPRCARRLPDDQFRLDHNLPGIGVVVGAGNAAQEGLSGDHAHLLQRLAYCRELWPLEGGALNVVKSHDGNVAGNLKSVTPQRLDRAD